MKTKINPDRYFFTGIAIWFTIIGFWGFAPSFYLLPFDQAAEPVQIHLYK